ncbi:hypothetical protein [Nocardia sp. NPDC057668]|uniref:hypothetical protein n=1 Tax=Nocardia sp. NPDC057668 TaxID=3346202 RepID=UPI00366B8083
MRMTTYDTLDPVTRARWDTNTVARFDEVDSLTDLVAAVDALRAAHAPARLLCTLDDVNQCMYTSMHAGLDERLTVDAGEVDENDVAAAHHADNRRAARIAEVLDDVRSRVEWDALTAAPHGAELDVEALVEVNTRPDDMIDDVVLVQRVPVGRDDLALAGIPNGYFQGDRDTFENHAVVRRLARHGYRHFGTGAALLGFDRPVPPTPAEIPPLITDLIHLFGAPDSPHWQVLAELLSNRRTLLIGYTEDFSELLDG